MFSWRQPPQKESTTSSLILESCFLSRKDSGKEGQSCWTRHVQMSDGPLLLSLLLNFLIPRSTSSSSYFLNACRSRADYLRSLYPPSSLDDSWTILLSIHFVKLTEWKRGVPASALLFVIFFLIPLPSSSLLEWMFLALCSSTLFLRERLHERFHKGFKERLES
jgi:hypothetical protein